MKKFVASLFAVILLAGCNIPYSDGTRAGYLTKFSYKGFICPTWEGSMNLGGVGQNSMVEFDFTVKPDKKDIIQFIQDATTTGKRVQMEYRQVAVPWFCDTDTGYFIESARYTE